MNSSRPQTPILELNNSDYKSWKDWKFDLGELSAAEITVKIKQLNALAENEIFGIRKALSRYNIVIYKTPHTISMNDEDIAQVARQLGTRISISNPESNDAHITVIKRHNSEAGTTRYIPYTNKALKWHTDGYYNCFENQVRSFILHCHTAAESGGENALLDHEIAYAQLRDNCPKLVSALCQNDAFTVPENRIQGKLVRPAFTGSVFNTDSTNGRLYMRYSQRTRNIIWKDDSDVTEARSVLNEILELSNPWAIRVSLKSGEGILCNNVLHCRNEFKDGTTHPRRLVRIRYNDRIADGVH